MDITVLPTLHRRISQATLKLVLAFGLVGVLLCTGFFFAGRAPDSLVSRNYDSVALARQMSTALAGWRFPELYVGKDRAAWQAEFELALAGARANVTETGEQAAVDAVARSWSELLLAGPEDADMGYNHVRMQLNALVLLNEEGIRQRIAEGALVARHRVHGGRCPVSGVHALGLFSDRRHCRAHWPIHCAARPSASGPSSPTQTPAPARAADLGSAYSVRGIHTALGAAQPA